MKQEPFPRHEEFGQMTLVLMEDVERCWDELHAATVEEDQNFWKRAFTRSVFALIEGYCEFFRSKALNAESKKLDAGLSSGEVSFNPGIFCVLLGVTHSINDDGEIKPQNLRTPFLANLLFCFNSFAEAHSATHRIKKGGHCWDKIRSAIRVRDNLMHPKNPDSLEITKNEIEDVVFTWRWFYQELHVVLKEVGVKIGVEFPEFSDDSFKLKLKKLE
jgi:hypothetical protein